MRNKSLSGYFTKNWWTTETCNALAKEHESIGIDKVIITHNVHAYNRHKDIIDGNECADQYHQHKCDQKVFYKEWNHTTANTT